MAGKDREAVPGVEYKDLELKPLKDLIGHIGESHPVTNHGSMMAILSEDPETGASTVIFRFPPGWRSHGPEFHNVMQEQFLIEGDMTFAGKRFEAPAYFLWPPKYVHGPTKSDGGALVFGTFDGPAHIEWTEYYEDMDWPE